MSDRTVGRSIIVRAGSVVYVADRQAKILHVLDDHQTVQVEDVESGLRHKVSITELKGRPTCESAEASPELHALSDSEWSALALRAEVIAPLAEQNRTTSSDIASAASRLGVSARTIYRLISIYRTTGKTTALGPVKRHGGRGKMRLDKRIEEIIQLAITTYYLAKQQRTASSTVIEVRRLCKNAGLAPPGDRTVRRRIAQISKKKQLASRSHRKEADDRYTLRPGHFEDAKRPLAIVQVDHTTVDIELVDEEHRIAIGKPWLTVVFDVYSRMVLGFSLSLDPPGANGTGIAIANALISKEQWLAKRGIKNPWPCSGFPSMVHVDNAGEFHGEMLKRACKQYGFEIDFRPVATPHYGGHIERHLGTLARAIHELPGSTFSNPKHRGEYDSEATAALTVSELEKYLAEFITGVYHNRLHHGIGMPPIKRWNDAIFGNGESMAIGSERPEDEERLRLDFMPVVHRTIQTDGVQIHKIQYSGDVLRRYVNAEENGRKKSFIFRTNPSDLSTIWFWDEELREHIPLFYRNTAHSAITLWELRAVRRKMKEEGLEAVDEDAIFDSYERLRRIRDTALAHTKSARRERARRRNRIAPPKAAAPEKPHANVVIPFPTVVRPFKIQRA